MQVISHFFILYIQVFVREKDTTMKTQNGNLSLQKQWRLQKPSNEKPVKQVFPLFPPI